MFRSFILLLTLLLAGLPVRAEEPMTLERLSQIVAAVDPEAEISANAMQLTIEGVPVIVVADATHDRMRAMVAIRSSAELTREDLYWMMQANFDSALDARYAVANGLLTAVFIHPLGALRKDEFLSGLGQVVNLTLSYGSTYSSGVLTFGGGDSRHLIEELQRKGDKI